MFSFKFPEISFEAGHIFMWVRLFQNARFVDSLPKKIDLLPSKIGEFENKLVRYQNPTNIGSRKEPQREQFWEDQKLIPHKQDQGETQKLLPIVDRLHLPSAQLGKNGRDGTAISEFFIWEELNRLLGNGWGYPSAFEIKNFFNANLDGLILGGLFLSTNPSCYKPKKNFDFNFKYFTFVKTYFKYIFL